MYKEYKVGLNDFSIDTAKGEALDRLAEVFGLYRLGGTEPDIYLRNRMLRRIDGQSEEEIEMIERILNRGW
jgi:tRNA A37 threonylcarbamoyltransferase TsaD